MSPRRGQETVGAWVVARPKTGFCVGRGCGGAPYSRASSPRPAGCLFPTLTATRTCFRFFLSFDTMSSTLATAVDFSKTSLYISLASIAFNPTAWNIVARNGRFNILVCFIVVFILFILKRRVSQQDLDASVWKPSYGMLLPRAVHLRLRYPSRLTVRANVLILLLYKLTFSTILQYIFLVPFACFY